MTYRHTTHFHSDYIDDTLDADRKRKIDKHLAECPACQEDLLRLKTLQQNLQNVLVNDPGEDYFEGLSDRVMAKVEALKLTQANKADNKQTSSEQRTPMVYTLRRLIQLSAAVTLLFGAFYLSGFEPDGSRHQLSADIVMKDAADSISEAEFPLDPETGINLTGPPYLTDQIKQKSKGN